LSTSLVGVDPHFFALANLGTQYFINDVLLHLLKYRYKLFSSRFMGMRGLCSSLSMHPQMYLSIHPK
jgi:hypothetical protein